ncbi:ABC transporter ATP-binding protein [Aquibacillus salsiterrae]|uniref:ABC transporter ATP-binding protein n=1 Tax=Aquibacillus salsiterrae TaxID=2950439 RepID=A0A9X3WIC8_9BACI|nr:ABC transporter ATP-binding protein [Aquibacillus salsiterrae]MDC3418004.1 ABC transporter ATP-binding protein [Aquibacillus salsiterrae]
MIECKNLVKIYKVDNELEVMALQGLDLTVEKGELMGIIGSSGSGKSTLLNMLGGLDRPSAGNLIVDGQSLLNMSDKELVQYKLQTVGFIWQNNARNLIPYLTARQNVELPMLLNGKRKKARAIELLEMVGLGHRLNNRLSELSGGEQQRVAIAIALANQPKLLLADEPTGNVDTKTADIILDLFRYLNNELGVTIVIVTHDMKLTKKMDRVVAIRDGKTSSEILRRKFFDEQGRELLMDEDGEPEDSHVELAVMDQAGRLQIPRDYLEAIGFESDNNKVQIELHEGRIVLLNPDEEQKKSC